MGSKIQLIKITSSIMVVMAIGLIFNPCKILAANDSTQNKFSIDQTNQYLIKANISPKLNKVDLHNFSYVDLNTTATSNNVIVTKQSDNKYLIRQTNENNKFQDEEIPFITNYYNLDKYPQFQLQYGTSLTEQHLGVQFYIDSNHDGKVDTIAYALDPSAMVEQPKLSVDLNHVNIKKKNWVYNIKRLLGLGQTDETWYQTTINSNMQQKDDTQLNARNYALTFNSSGNSEVVLQRRINSLDLSKYPYVNLDFNIQDPQIQHIYMEYNIDTNNDGRPDSKVVVNQPLSKNGKIYSIDTNVLELAKKNIPNAKSYHLVEVIMHLQKKEGASISGSDSYIYNLLNLKVLNKEPMVNINKNENLSSQGLKYIDLNANNTQSQSLTTINIDLKNQLINNLQSENFKILKASLIASINNNAAEGLYQAFVNNIAFYNNETESIPLALSQGSNRGLAQNYYSKTYYLKDNFSVDLNSLNDKETDFNNLNEWKVASSKENYNFQQNQDKTVLNMTIKRSDIPESVTLSRNFNVLLTKIPYLIFNAGINDKGESTGQYILCKINYSDGIVNKEKGFLLSPNNEYNLQKILSIQDPSKSVIKNIQLIFVSNNKNSAQFTLGNFNLYSLQKESLLDYLKKQKINIVKEDNFDLTNTLINSDKNNGAYNIIRNNSGIWIVPNAGEFLNMDSISFTISGQQLPVNLEDLPNVYLAYNQSSYNSLEYSFGIDTTGDGIVDQNVNVDPANYHAGIIDFNLLQRIKEIAPSKSSYYLRYIKIFIKNDTFNQSELYSLNLSKIKLYNNQYETTVYKQILDVPIIKVDSHEYKLSDVQKFDDEQLLKIIQNGNAWVDIATMTLEQGTHKIEYLDNPYIDVDLTEVDKYSENKQVQEPIIKFNRINPTRYNVDITAKDPFWLVFDESYNDGWKAYVIKSNPAITSQRFSWSVILSNLWQGKNRIEVTKHEMVNGYANGWWIEPAKIFGNSASPVSFQVVLEYEPQKYFEIGVLVLAITLFLYFGYLIIDNNRIKKKVKKNEERVTQTDNKVDE